MSGESVRAQVDALVGEIAAAKRREGAASATYKALVARMTALRAQLPQKDSNNSSNKGTKATTATAAATTTTTREPTYYESRLAMVQSLGLLGAAYPHKFDVEYTLPQLRAAFASRLTQPGERADACVRIAGRIMAKRSSGAKLHFLTLHGDLDAVQIISTEADYADGASEFAAVHARVKRGDVVGVVGYPSRSKTGEFSVSATSITLLATCFHMLPDGYFGLSDLEQRFRQRYLDLIVNRDHTHIFLRRAQIIRYVRQFLDTRGFVEVETPTLNLLAGGAAARPFMTHHNDLNQRMYLRVSPELYLKELVVGGLDRVYELGKQFRNESIDLTHNPEFTSVEAYWAYHDYNDWMTATEELLHGLACELHGSPVVPYTPRGPDGAPLTTTTFNFSKPFKRLRIVPELERRLGVSFANVDFDSDAAEALLLSLCTQHHVECVPPHTTPRLLDALIAAFLEPECHDPCFLCDHPRVMSPLAKWHRDDARLTERFELFVNKKELVNAYTELNNPIVQREEFVKQMTHREKGDDESMQIDEDFVRALEYALPPTSGWGLGIDRLVMFLTSQANIKEVLLFPAMKPQGKDGVSGGSIVGTALAPLNGQGVPLLQPPQL